MKRVLCPSHTTITIIENSNHNSNKKNINNVGEDEADTVGCCSLRVEHISFPSSSPPPPSQSASGSSPTTSSTTSNTLSPQTISLDFLGCCSSVQLIPTPINIIHPIIRSFVRSFIHSFTHQIQSCNRKGFNEISCHRGS